MSLGQRLRQLRISKGLTQEQIAKFLDIPRSTHTNWELDRKEPDKIEMLKKIATFFNVSIDYLLGEVPNLSLKEKELLDDIETEKDIFKILEKHPDITFDGKSISEDRKKFIIQFLKTYLDLNDN